MRLEQHRINFLEPEADLGYNLSYQYLSIKNWNSGISFLLDLDHMDYDGIGKKLWRLPSFQNENQKGSDRIILIVLLKIRNID